MQTGLWLIGKNHGVSSWKEFQKIKKRITKNKWVPRYTKFQANKLFGPYETAKDRVRACMQNRNSTSHFQELRQGWSLVEKYVTERCQYLVRKSEYSKCKIFLSKMNASLYFSSFTFIVRKFLFQVWVLTWLTISGNILETKKLVELYIL